MDNTTTTAARPAGAGGAARLAVAATDESSRTSSTTTAHLVADIREKLDDLSRRLEAYRRDLTTEFESFHAELLQDVDRDVAAEVRRVIAHMLGSDGDFPALGLTASAASTQTASASGAVAGAGAGAGSAGSTSPPESPGPVISTRLATALRKGSPPPSRGLTGPSSPVSPSSSSPAPRTDSATKASSAKSSSGQEAPGSPHEREREFHGIFTPGYLPLLDGSQSEGSSNHAGAGGSAGVQEVPKSLPQASARTQVDSPNAAGTGAAAASGKPRDKDEQETGARGPSLGQAAEPAGGSAALARRPHPPRRATDDTTSSVTSDRSDTSSKGRRRSALRRRSSSSISTKPKSPHRVRFETPTGEVLPSTSPPAHELASPQQAQAHSMPSSYFREDDSSTAESILGPDLEEPPPKRVSSAQRLRELSRLPLDNPTEWTEVTQPGVDDAAIRAINKTASGKLEEPTGTLTASSSTATVRASDFPISKDTMPSLTGRTADLETIKTVTLLGRPLEERGSQQFERDDSSEDDFLSMGKSKTFATKKPKMPIAAAPSPPTSASPTKASPPTPVAVLPRSKHAVVEPAAKDKTVLGSGRDGAAEDDEDEDEMFEFESGGLSMASRKPKPRPFLLSQEDDEPESLELEAKGSPAPLNLYATSPAVAIRHTRDAIAAAPAPPTPTTSKFQSGSLGSYRGRPVMMPVVTNPEVQAKAETMGEFNSFVGGLDGRSGMDAADISSFRASLAGVGTFTGTPKSLTERMILEDAEEERAGAEARRRVP